MRPGRADPKDTAMGTRRPVHCVHIDSEMGFNDAIYVVSAAGGTPRAVVRGDILRGLSWLPDGSGLVFGSAEGSTVTYPPTFQLRRIRLGETVSDQLTNGADSHTDPDLIEWGRVLAKRTAMQLGDLGRCQSLEHPLPTCRLPGASRMTPARSRRRRPVRMARQLVYLADSGGHGNLWVIGSER